MVEATQESVKNQSSKVAEQVVQVIQLCNEEKRILEEEFDCVQKGNLIIESKLRTEMVRIDSEVSGVRSMMHLQQVALQALHTGIRILQGCNNWIVSEAT